MLACKEAAGERGPAVLGVMRAAQREGLFGESHSRLGERPGGIFVHGGAQGT